MRRVERGYAAPTHAVRYVPTAPTTTIPARFSHCLASARLSAAALLTSCSIAALPLLDAPFPVALGPMMRPSATASPEPEKKVEVSADTFGTVRRLAPWPK